MGFFNNWCSQSVRAGAICSELGSDGAGGCRSLSSAVTSMSHSLLSQSLWNMAALLHAHDCHPTPLPTALCHPHLGPGNASPFSPFCSCCHSYVLMCAGHVGTKITVAW